jgi:epoxide hydrolase-like predicted phosphatase
VAVAAVAFDMGGVLTEPPFRGLEEYARELGVPAQTFSQYFRGDSTMAQLETGTITSREFFKYVCISCQADYPVRVDIHRLAAAAAMGERLRPEAFDLVREVHQLTKTALLTNNVETAGWRAAFPFQLFDVVVDSSQVGARKPDPAIYRLMIDALTLEPGNIAFFDDFEENIEPARRLGIQAFVFTTLEGCRADLVELGVLGRTA